MDPIPGQLPAKYIGTYLDKPVTKSKIRAPSWNSFISNRIGPTTVGDLTRILQKFYWFRLGKPDDRLGILIDVLNKCNQMTYKVYSFLEQGRVKNNPEKMFLLNRALLRNHKIWNKLANTSQRCIRRCIKSPRSTYLCTLEGRPNAFDGQHSWAASYFLEKLVKRTLRDPRSGNLFGRSLLVDEMREYTLTTGMLVSDIEAELDGKDGPEAKSELERDHESILE